MAVKDDLLVKEFSNLINKQQSQELSTIYATGVVQGDKKYIRIDGSNMLTPADETVDFQEGDRLLVTISNHKASILGNLSYPPSARDTQTALDKAEGAETTANGFKDQINNVNEKADQANDIANSAKDLANQAKEEVNGAIDAAEKATQAAKDAYNKIDEVNQNIDTVYDKVGDVTNIVNNVNIGMEELKNNVTNVTNDLTSVRDEVQQQAGKIDAITSELETTVAKKTDIAESESTLRSEISQAVDSIKSEVSEDYASKNDLTSIEGNLQSQITQNKDSISQTVSRVETVESNTSAMQAEVNLAKEIADEAQAEADRATANANAAEQSAADALAQANIAQQKADNAQKYSEEAERQALLADLKLTEAKTALDEAKKEYELVKGNPDASPEDIKAAEDKVKRTEANVISAMEEAQESKYAAARAKAAAMQAMLDAENATNAAKEAEDKALEANEIANAANDKADKAQQDLAGLTHRVEKAETDITQNTEQIQMTASKTTEIGNKLENDYFNKEEVLARIKIEADKITQEISSDLIEQVGNGIDNIILDSSSSLNRSTFYSTTMLGEYYLDPLIEIKNGDDYTFSCHFEGLQVDEHVFNIYFRDKNDKAWKAPAIPITNEDYKVTFKYTPPEGFIAERIRFTISNRHHEMIMTKAMLNRGIEALRWRANIADTIGGGRNYLLDSKQTASLGNSAVVYYLPEALKDRPNVGEIYTFSIKYDATGLGPATTGGEPPYFILANTNGNCQFFSNIECDYSGYMECTFKWTNTVENVTITNPTRIAIYLKNANKTVPVEYAKLERGGQATEWVPAPEDADVKFDSTIEEFNTKIEQTKTEITQTVEQTKTEITNDTQTKIESVRNEMSLTSEGLEIVKETTDSLKNELTGKIDAESILEWARFDGATLELGVSNSLFKAKLSNNALEFYQGETKVAWLSNNELYTSNANAKDTITIGNYTLIDEGDDGFSIK